MATTFKAIATVTVGSGGASSIAFTSIPGTYTDLLLKLSIRTNRSGQDNDALFISINSNTSNLSNKIIESIGSGTPSGYSTSGATMKLAALPGSTATASVFGNAEVYFPNYANSNNKPFSADSVTENNATQAIAALTGNVWSDTSAITSLSLTPGYGTSFNQYSTATLYGIKNS